MPTDKEAEFVVKYPSGRYLKHPAGEFTDSLDEAHGWKCQEDIEVGPGAVGPAIIRQRSVHRANPRLK